MPITYAVDVENMTVRLHASNPLTADDLETYYSVSRADPSVSPDMHRIVDLRAIAPLPGCADVVRVARSRRGAKPIGPEVRIAVIVDSDLAYGVAMQFGAHAGLEDDELRVFWRESEAVAWIDHGLPVAAAR